MEKFCKVPGAYVLRSFSRAPGQPDEGIVHPFHSEGGGKEGTLFLPCQEILHRVARVPRPLPEIEHLVLVEPRGEGKGPDHHPVGDAECEIEIIGAELAEGEIHNPGKKIGRHLLHEFHKDVGHFQTAPCGLQSEVIRYQPGILHARATRNRINKGNVERWARKKK